MVEPSIDSQSDAVQLRWCCRDQNPRLNTTVRRRLHANAYACWHGGWWFWLCTHPNSCSTRAAATGISAAHVISLSRPVLLIDPLLTNRRKGEFRFSQALFRYRFDEALASGKFCLVLKPILSGASCHLDHGNAEPTPQFYPTVNGIAGAVCRRSRLCIPCRLLPIGVMAVSSVIHQSLEAHVPY
jgi:hypothetical protein